MNDVRYLEVIEEEVGQRLDNYLLRILKGVPKSHVYRIVRSGQVRVNKKRAQVNLRLQLGDLIRIPPVRMSETAPVPVSHHLGQRLEACILYEDDQLIVLNKPAGIAVHGGSGVSLGVIEALRAHRQDIPYLELVHRLDKETSGCLLLAKKRSMLRSIQALLEARQIHKIYWAVLTHPWLDQKKLAVNVPLEKNILKSGERIVVVNPAGKSAQTQYQLLENFSSACWVEVMPKTGRTHQIRVHSAYLNHPIIGDQKYGQPTAWLPLAIDSSRLYLHARAIQFNLAGKNYSFTAEIDAGFAKTLQILRV